MPQCWRAEQIYCICTLSYKHYAAQEFLVRHFYILLITFCIRQSKYIVKAGDQKSEKGGADLEDSREQFEKIYVQTKEMIYNRIAAKCYAIDDVDDIFQNTYAAVFKALKGLDAPPPNPEAFVMLICNRQLAKYYSAARKLREKIALRMGTAEDWKEEYAEPFTIEDSIIDRAALTERYALLRRKPLITQKVFFLYYRRGLTIPQAAKELEISEASVKMHLYRTLDEIRRRYREERAK